MTPGLVLRVLTVQMGHAITWYKNSTGRAKQLHGLACTLALQMIKANDLESLFQCLAAVMGQAFGISWSNEIAF